MTDHPLTNEDCKQILIDVSDYWCPEKDVSTPMAYELMRAAYDKGVADRLEQAIEWLKGELYYRSDIDPNLLSEFKKAMRPSTKEDN